MSMSMTEVADYLLCRALSRKMPFLSTVEAIAVSLVAATIATTTSMILALLAELLCPQDFYLVLNCF